MSRRSNSTRRLERREQRQARQPGTTPRERRNRPATGARRSTRGGGGPSGTTLAIIGGVVFMVALLGYVIWQSGESGPAEAAWQRAQMNDDVNLPGSYVPPHPGGDGELNTADDREHFANGRIVPICTQEQIQSGNISNPLCYQSNPPTSGPHAVSPAQFKVLENPAPKENLIHNMEHGGIVVWYNTSNQQAIDRLKSIVEEELDRRRLVVMSQYAEMEPETIALTAWTRIDKFPVSELNEDRVRDFIDAHNKRFNPEGF